MNNVKPFPATHCAGLASAEEIIADIRAGRMVVLVDDEDRENEGDLVLAADCVTPEAINFMARHGRGLICLTLTEERCRQLNLPLMVSENRSPMGTNFTLSIEAAAGVTTGISAADRSRTVQAAVARNAKAEDIVQPGHIFPLMAKNGGVLVRAGHTEAGCDLAALAGREPAAVICEILKDDGSMARLPDLIEYATEHKLKLGTIADLIEYRSRNEKLVERIATREIDTRHGPFTLHAYRDAAGDETHLALVRGEVLADNETLVRVHTPLSVLDLLDLNGTGHSIPLDKALGKIAAHGSGVAVLLRAGDDKSSVRGLLDQPTRKVRPIPKWDSRIYGIGAQILRDLGVVRMRLLAHPTRMPSMAGFGLEVTGFVTLDDTDQ